MPEDDLALIISPPKPRKSIQKEPNCVYIPKELQRPGVTLTLLWEKYVSQCKTIDAYPLQ